MKSKKTIKFSKRSIKELYVLIFLLLVALNIQGSNVNNIIILDILPNFKLNDQNGLSHEMYYYKYKKELILLFIDSTCLDYKKTENINLSIPSKTNDSIVLVIDSNEQLAKIIEQRSVNMSDLPDFDQPILYDVGGLISHVLGIPTFPYQVSVRTKDWKIEYAGTPYNTLINEINKEILCYPLVKKRKDVVQSISYNNSIVPILAKYCIHCHSNGGIAPWSMDQFTKIKGFSPMIKEVILTKRMPPLRIDNDIGYWKGQPIITVDERKTLIDWIDHGSDNKSTVDRLPQIHQEISLLNERKWSKSPDIVLDIPEMILPERGNIPYQYHVIPTNISEPVWIRSIAVNPGSPKSMHHALIGIRKKDKDITLSESSVFSMYSNFLGGYTPGLVSITNLPADTGILLSPGDQLWIQIHYVSLGKVIIDRSQIKLFTHKDKPSTTLNYGFIQQPNLLIPPHDRNYASYGSYTFEKDVILYALHPHGHFRAKSAKFILEYPSGDRKLLLSIPDYDFNWQAIYELKSPVSIPTNSRLILSMTYDNSKENLGNPDPNKWVRWGLQSTDEMLFGVFSFSYIIN